MMNEILGIVSIVFLVGLMWTVFLPQPLHDRVGFPIGMAVLIFLLIMAVVGPISLLIWAFF
mgnify:CR=1 FL=1